MKTLNKSVTAKFFRNENGYEELVNLWSTWVNSSPKTVNLTAAKQLFYLILRGRDWRRGFTPVKSTKKLDNGAYKYYGAFWAFLSLSGLDNTPRRVRVAVSGDYESQEEATLRAKEHLLKWYPEIVHLLSDNFIEELNSVLDFSKLKRYSDFEEVYTLDKVYKS